MLSRVQAIVTASSSCLVMKVVPQKQGKKKQFSYNLALNW